jgi:hypothetical protein
MDIYREIFNPIKVEFRNYLESDEKFPNIFINKKIKN